jgi:hypothetical protein
MSSLWLYIFIDIDIRYLIRHSVGDLYFVRDVHDAHVDNHYDDDALGW